MAERVQRTTWVFTLNNPTNEEKEYISKWVEDRDDITVCTIGEEVGAEGTPHLQGAIRFARGKRFGWMRRQVSERAHWEPAKSSDPFTYCRKEGKMLVDIDHRKQGKRTDLDVAVEAMASGGIAAVVQNHPVAWIKYNKGFRDLAKMQYELGKKKRKVALPWAFRIVGWDRSKVCAVLHGETGMGKTEFAMDQFEQALMVRQKDDLKRFIHGFHDGIVFDDTVWLAEQREEQIKILDIGRETTIKCRYEDAIVPAGIPRIFTTNVIDGHIFDLADPAIKRRVIVSERIVAPMWHTGAPSPVEDDDDDTSVCVPETPPRLRRAVEVPTVVPHPRALRAPPILFCESDLD